MDGYDIGAPYDGVPYDSDGPPDLDIAVHSESNGHVIGQLAGPEDTASGEFTPALLTGSRIPLDALLLRTIFVVTERDVEPAAPTVVCLGQGRNPFDGTVITSECPVVDINMSPRFTVRWHLERADR